MQLAPLTLEVEQQHAAALAEFFATAAEPLASPAHPSDQGAHAFPHALEQLYATSRHAPYVVPPHGWF